MAKKKATKEKAPKELVELKRVDVTAEDGASLVYIFFEGKGNPFNIQPCNAQAHERLEYFRDPEVADFVRENDELPEQPEPEVEETEKEDETEEE